jgi:dUTP pyrophosphatase
MKICKAAPDAIIPKVANQCDAAFDMYANVSATLYPGEQKMISLGIRMEVPENHAALLVPRSGSGSKGLHLANVIGVIDPSYRGVVMANVKNNSDDLMLIDRGERICQMLIVPVWVPKLQVVEELSDTVRGEGGWGSTGVR